MRPSLAEVSTQKCPHCGGSGFIRSTESTALRVLRGIEEAGTKSHSAAIKVSVPASVAIYILNQKRIALSLIERRHDLEITFDPDDSLIPPNYRLEKLKLRDRDDIGPAPVRAGFDMPADAAPTFIAEEPGERSDEPLVAAAPLREEGSETMAAEGDGALRARGEAAGGGGAVAAVAVARMAARRTTRRRPTASSPLRIAAPTWPQCHRPVSPAWRQSLTTTAKHHRRRALPTRKDLTDSAADRAKDSLAVTTKPAVAAVAGGAADGVGARTKDPRARRRRASRRLLFWKRPRSSRHWIPMTSCAHARANSTRRHRDSRTNR